MSNTTSTFTRFARAVVPIVALSFVVPAEAVSTRTFVLDSQEELSAGKLDGTAVHSDGSVTAGADIRRLDLPDVPVAWSLARTPDERVYIGTGNDGTIYELRGDELSAFAETDELLVSSLAVGDDGTLYAGTLPKGRIYAIDSDGSVRKLARPGKAQHIWALVWDGERDTLFAGTGPNGKVVSVDRQGNTETYFDTAAAHVMSLALGTDGNVYAGTTEEALVLAIEGPGRAEVLHDFPGNEITALAARKGQLAVTANEFPEPPGVPSDKSKGRPPRPEPGNGQLWRLDTDGRAEKVFDHDEGHFTSIQLAKDGTIFAGAGKDGRIYRVGPDRTTATWIDVDERQVLDLDLLGSRPLFVTGDTGAVYRVLQGKPQQAAWYSKVLDADFRARWGRITWRAQGTLEVQTRSGNTSEPTDTWSEWSEPMTSPGPVRSPAARFLQIRIRFDRDPDAELRAVRAYYLPRNQRPVITHVGLDNADPHTDGKPPEPSTKYDLSWEVDNPDDDEVRYRVRFRAEGQDVWRPMLREHEKLTDTDYTWATSGVPDGWYVIQVEASDEPSNPDELTLRSTEESEPLLIDNHAPRIVDLRATGGRVRGRAVDSVGPIAGLEYAVDGGEWHPFFPTDHLLDTRDESFELELDELDAGSHIVAVRATDAGGNAVSAELTLRVGGSP